MSDYRDTFRDYEKEARWTAPRIFLWLGVAIIAIYGLCFLVTGGDLAIYRFWAPKRANAEREVFVNTNSYIQGKISQLTQLRLAYEQADGAQKSALRTAIIAEAAQVDLEKLPPELAAFIANLRGQE